MSPAKMRRKNSIYIAIQIPLEGKVWVEAGRFRSLGEAFQVFERNDANTVVFSLPELLKLLGKIFAAVNSISSKGLAG